MGLHSDETIEKNNICAIIVTYNGKETISSTIEYLKKNVNHIVIIDNNSTDGTKDFIETIKSTTLEVINLNKNYGIAYALNIGVEYANLNEFNWILTMDQDSVLSEDMIDEMIKVYKKIPNKDKVACLSPRRLNGENSSYQKKNCIEYYEKNAVITSGNLVKTSVINEMEGYEEKLFIDSVDFDFCLRLKESRYKILICNNATMTHFVGETKEVKLLNKNINIHVHSSIRKYYMSRNYIYIMKNYFIKQPWFCLKMSLFSFILIFQVIIYEKNVFNNLKIILKGIVDGMRGKFGEKIDL